MSSLPDDPFKQISNMRKDFDRLFSAFPFDFSFFDQMLGNYNSLKVNVHETPTEVIATFDIPGLEKDNDIQIHVEHNVLSIKGSVNTATEVKEENMFSQSHYASDFYRSIYLPSPVSREGVKANYRNGVLEVRMQKTAQETMQHIRINFD